MADRPPEVLVVGAGPAGTAAARLLALWGHDVVLVSRPPSPGLALAESIPPSCRKLFDLLGVTDLVDGAGFVRSTGNTVSWGSDAIRTERFADGQCGWQATADRLSALLSSAAVAAGARLESALVTSQEALGRHAALTLDCTGRAGVFARARGLRVYEPGLHTVALIGLWRAALPFDLPDPTHTVIESYSNGWAWSVPASSHERHVAVMVDPRTSALLRGSGAAEVYHAEIASTVRIRDLVSRAEMIDGPAGWDASMYHAARLVDDTVVLVGDAASFVDPLSSAGVKKALASGWLAAVASHTALARPEMHAAAFDFFATRERRVYDAFRAKTVEYLGAAAGAHPQPFWDDRLDLGARASGSIESDALKAAFERIRTAETLAVERAPAVRVEPRAAVNGREIVWEGRLVSDDCPDGVRFAYGVDLTTLIEMAPGHAQVPDLLTAYSRRVGPVDMPDFLAALATLMAGGWLVWRQG